MHSNTFQQMQKFKSTHVDPRFPQGGRVLDVGSYDVNGSYRPIWGSPWQYKGVDIEAGPGVDQVVPESGDWLLQDPPFDVVISGQCIEHCRRPWKLVATIGRHIKPGGLFCLIAPFAWEHHRYPIDCYRFAPDGMDVLLEEAGCDRIASFLSNINHGDGLPWAIDCVAYGVKR